MTYEIEFYNDVTKESEGMMAMVRERFTKHDYDKIIRFLYQTACLGIENRSLFADVFCCYTRSFRKRFLTVSCETTVNGSTIDAHIFVNSTHVRDMNIAR